MCRSYILSLSSPSDFDSKSIILLEKLHLVTATKSSDIRPLAITFGIPTLLIGKSHAFASSPEVLVPLPTRLRFCILYRSLDRLSITILNGPHSDWIQRVHDFKFIGIISQEPGSNSNTCNQLMGRISYSSAVQLILNHSHPLKSINTIKSGFCWISGRFHTSQLVDTNFSVAVQGSQITRHDGGPDTQGHWIDGGCVPIGKRGTRSQLC